MILSATPPPRTLLLRLVDDAHRAFAHEGDDAVGSDAIRMGGRRRRRLPGGACVVFERSVLCVVHEPSGQRGVWRVVGCGEDATAVDHGVSR